MYLVGLLIYYLCSRTVVVKVALCLSEEPIIVTKKLIYASNSTSWATSWPPHYKLLLWARNSFFWLPWTYGCNPRNRGMLWARSRSARDIRSNFIAWWWSSWRFVKRLFGDQTFLSGVRVATSTMRELFGRHLSSSRSGYARTICILVLVLWQVPFSFLRRWDFFWDSFVILPDEGETRNVVTFNRLW